MLEGHPISAALLSSVDVVRVDKCSRWVVAVSEVIRITTKCFMLNFRHMIPSVFPLSRRKSVPRWVRIAYLFKRGARVFGQRAWLRLWLNAAWVTNRIAREVCFDTNRADFRKAGQALSEELLARWLPANSAVLDIGCGLGEWSRIASKYAARVVGIDLNASYIAQNQTSHLPHNVLFMLSDATTVLPEQRFDVVLMIHLIEHIEDPSLLLRQARDKAPGSGRGYRRHGAGGCRALHCPARAAQQAPQR